MSHAFVSRSTPALALATTAVVFGLVGCAQDIRSASPLDPCKVPGVTCVSVVLPPVLAVAGGLRQVAIAPGTGPGAGALATQLETRLSSVQVDDKSFYTLMRPGDARRQATFEISSTEWSVGDQRETQDRVKCIDSKCTKSTTTKVSCRVRKATVGALIRLRGADAREIGTREASGAGTSTQCDGESGILEAPAVVLGQASGKALDQLQDALAVRTVKRRVRVMDDASQIGEAGRKQRFAEGVKFAKAGRMDRACPLFADLSEIDTKSVAVFYNLGFCEQVVGNWRKAFEWYSRADANSSKPLGELKDALDETRAYGVQKAG